MSVYLDILFLALGVVFIVDLSGFTDTFLRVASMVAGRKLTSLRPFTCSKCLTFWGGNILAIALGGWTLAVFAYVCGLAFATGLMQSLAVRLYDLITKLIRKI